jgi:nitroreductase
MKNLIQIIKNRRTIHKYKNEKVDDELLNGAIEASLFAPNHRLTNPTRIYSLGSLKRNELMNFSIKLKEQKKGALSSDDKEQETNKYQCPSHILVFTRIKSSNEVQEKEDYATLSCVIHNLSLLLWEKDIGLKWSTGSLIKESELYKIFSIDPDLEMIEGIIRVGKAEKIKPSPPRLVMKDIFTQTS